MKNRFLKWILVGLISVVCVAAIARIGFAAHQYQKSRTAASELEALSQRLRSATDDAADKRFQPSNAVRQLLDRKDARPATVDGTYPCIFADVSGQTTRPEFGRCGSFGEPSGAVDRFEVDLRFGSFVLRQTDMYMQDGFEVPLTRTYSSTSDPHENPILQSFGNHSDHPFDDALVGPAKPFPYVMAMLQDGNFVYFSRIAPGDGYADAVYQHTETSTSDYKAVIAWNGDGWTLSRADGSAVLFPQTYGASEHSNGSPYAMRDAHGNILRLQRNGKRELQEIRTANGQAMEFLYDGHSRIVRAEIHDKISDEARGELQKDDDHHRWAAYQYDANGMLTTAIFPDDHSRHYAYQGDLMTLVTDENNKVWVRNTYDKRWLTRQDYGDGKVYSYNYATSADGLYARSATITFPDGTSQTVDTGSSVPEVSKHPAVEAH